MKKLLVLLLAIVLVVAAWVPAASARGWHHRGGCFGCGFGFGFFSGALLGGALAAPFYYYPPYYYAPPYYAYPPPYYAPPVSAAPAPSCYAQGGHWEQAPLSSSGGYTTYQNVWVPGQTVCR